MAKKNFKNKLSKNKGMHVDPFGNIMEAGGITSPSTPGVTIPDPQNIEPHNPVIYSDRPPVTLPEDSPWGPISPTLIQHLFFIDHITIGNQGSEIGPNDWIGVFKYIPNTPPDNWILCGARQWNGDCVDTQACTVTAYGNDNMGSCPQCPFPGDRIRFKIYRTSTEDNFTPQLYAGTDVLGAVWFNDFINNGLTIIPEINWTGGGGGSCFVKDTLISTPNGQIPIQTLKAGDEIYSFDAHNDDISVDTISKLISHTPEEDIYGLYKITTKTNKVTTTGNHPFIKLNPEYNGDDADWISARLLEVGDKIYDENGITQIITSIEKLDYKENTYNFTVKNNHTYVAGGFRVHNAMSKDKGFNPTDEIDWVGTRDKQLDPSDLKHEVGGKVSENRMENK